VNAPWRLGHRPSLDAIRGIAVLLVVVGHVFLQEPAMTHVVTAQTGLALFFALSGFLITAILLDEWGDKGRIDLRRFYSRRVRRLAPALIVFVPIIVLVGLAPWYALPSSAFYVTNWLRAGSAPLGALEHTWSLAVEEQFYIVWPSLLAILLILRRTVSGTVVLIAGSALIAVALWPDNVRVVSGSDTRASGLLLGALGAILAKRGRLPRISLAVLAAAILWMAWSSTGVEPQYELAVQTVTAGVVVAWAAQHPAAMAWRWLTATGRISYGMYLWHYPLIFVWPAGGLPLGARIALVIAVTYALAGLSWFAVERRFLLPTVRRRVTMPPMPSWSPDPSGSSLP
jgi:peptidoglycan/LPS O-acetylase OafA/YrhL